MTRRVYVFLGVIGLIVLAGWAASSFFRSGSGWSEAELKKIRSLWIDSLPPVPPDPSNRVADDPGAVALGQAFFFDSRFSANGYVSCATCHRPEQGFQDDLPLGKGVASTNRRTPPLIGVAYSPWFFWDGRKDSLWAQALSPLEGAAEHGGQRFEYARTIVYFYAANYEALFGPLPALDWTARWEDLREADQAAVTAVFVNMGKALEAYERTLLPRPSQFDRYASALLSGNLSTAQSILSPEQAAGLRLFIGKGDCTLCHNTPLFTDYKFHNTGVPAVPGQAPDPGWAAGLPLMLEDEFGCKGRWSDAGPSGGCPDQRYLVVGIPNQLGAFKTPTLRNVADRTPYMHAGQIPSLADVLQHYIAAPTAPIGKSELNPLGLTETEVEQLLAFLDSLSEEK